MQFPLVLWSISRPDLKYFGPLAFWAFNSALRAYGLVGEKIHAYGETDNLEGKVVILMRIELVASKGHSLYLNDYLSSDLLGKANQTNFPHGLNSE